MRSGAQMLAPRWWWPPRVRPLLKELPPFGEFAGHLYVRGIRALPEYITGVRRTLVEATSRREIRFFAGEAGQFRDLTGAHEVLHDALKRMATRRLQIDGAYIAAHVRRGDFARVTSEEVRTRGAARTPIEWFVQAFRAVRQAAKSDVPLLVVSDGREADLRKLLDESNVHLVRTAAPLSDLLVLSGARVLLASGSSFSAWGAFLGGMPVATHPGQSLGWFGVPVVSWLGEFEPGAGDSSFVRAAAAALSDHVSAFQVLTPKKHETED